MEKEGVINLTGRFDFFNELLFQFRQSELSRRMAKEHDYEFARGNLVDQRMQEHIESGLYALKSMVYFFDTNTIPMDDLHLEYASLAYILHDIHKVEKAEGESVYSQTLDDFEVWRRQLQHRELEIPSAFLRLAGVSRFSGKYGDFTQLPPGIDWLTIRSLVKMMDRAASITSIKELAKGNGLQHLKHSILELFPPSLQSRLEVEYHYMEEMRGLLSNRIHLAVSTMMKENGFFPWLYFADGTLYLKIKQQDEELPIKDVIIKTIVSQFYQDIAHQSGSDYEQFLDRSTLQLQTYSFLVLSTTEQLLHRVEELLTVSSSGSKNFPNDKFPNSQLDKYGIKSIEELFGKMLHVQPIITNELREKWFFHARYLKVVLNVLRQLDGLEHREAFNQLAKALQCENVMNIYDRIQNISNNRRYDDTIFIAYYYLHQLRIDGRTVEELPSVEINQHTVQILLQNLGRLITPEKAFQYVEENLRINEDLTAYLKEQLILSFNRTRRLDSIPDKELMKKKSGSQKKICNICNRTIPAKAEPKMKAAIVDDDIQVFSNRLLPKQGNVSALHWCPVCQLEFIMRKVFPFQQSGKREKSRRLYLYIFPTFQLTGERYAELHEELDFQYTTLSFRPSKVDSDTWQKIFLNPLWNDENIQSYLLEHWNRREELINQQLEENGYLYSTGDLIRSSEFHNYMLAFFDCYSSNEERTREEAWMKAFTYAISLNLLYGFRVYITERPFFSLSDINELVYAVHLDAPPLKIQNEFSMKSTALGVGVPAKMIRLTIQKLAAIWELNLYLSNRKDNKNFTDKGISSTLQLVTIHPLAGPHVVKRTLNNGYPANESLMVACRLLNQMKGGKLMSIAERIARASCQLYIPSSKQDGRAHRYENLFRTVVKAIKDGADPFEIYGTVSKRLDRLRRASNYGYFLKYQPDDVKKLVDIIYDEFYLQECKGNLFILKQRENQVADGVFFITHQLVKEYWESNKKEEKVNEDE